MNLNRSTLYDIKKTLPETTRLVAVSKFHPVENIIELYNQGQRLFGESRVQELLEKKEKLSHLHDIKWHFIGPLQRNKVKYIVSFIDLIESVSSVTLLDEIDKQAQKIGKKINILLELHIAQETNKIGFTQNEILDLLQSICDNTDLYSNINFCGLMAIASNTDDMNLVESEFETVESLFNEINTRQLYRKTDSFVELSMGMSSDYLIAIKHHATLVRIGSKLFGDRIY